MNIFEKLMGGNSDLDKWALFFSLGYGLAGSDGEFSKSEGHFSGAFLREKGNLSDADLKKVIEKSQNIKDPIEKVQKLSNDDQLELFKYLIGLASADGKFHGNEYLAILALVFAIGIDPQVITNIICNLDTVDPEELRKAYQKMIDENTTEYVYPALSFKKN